MGYFRFLLLFNSEIVFFLTVSFSNLSFYFLSHFRLLAPWFLKNYIFISSPPVFIFYLPISLKTTRQTCQGLFVKNIVNLVYRSCSMRNFDENFKITRLDDKTLKALVRKKQHIVIIYYVYWGNKELIYFQFCLKLILKNI